MKTPVVLSITGRQKYADQEPETLQRDFRRGNGAAKRAGLCRAGV